MQISNVFFQQAVSSARSPQASQIVERKSSFESALSKAGSRSDREGRRVDRNTNKDKRGGEKREVKEGNSKKDKLEEIKELIESMDSEEVSEALVDFIAYILGDSVDLEVENLNEIDLEELGKELGELMAKLGELDLSQLQGEKDLRALVKTLEMADDLMSNIESKLESSGDISIGEGFKALDGLDIEELRKNMELLKVEVNKAILNEKVLLGEGDEVQLLELKHTESKDTKSLRSKNKGREEVHTPQLEAEAELSPDRLSSDKDLLNLKEKILYARSNIGRGEKLNQLEDAGKINLPNLNSDGSSEFELDKLLFTQNFKNEFNHTMQNIAGKEAVTEQNFLNMDKLDIIKQISSKLGINGVDSASEIKIKLTPESLGAMTIKVTLEDGVVSARAIVENPHVKELMESNIALLRDSLKGQGVEFQKIDVFVGEDPSEEKHPNQSDFQGGSNKGRNGSANEDIELEDIEGILNDRVVNSDRVDTVV